MTKKPNFFIVGAPKSGTTAMYEYLRVHPEVFMSEVKEPYYFGSDLIYRMPRMTEDSYLALFTGATDEKMLGEGSVTYLYSKRAAREIKEFNPCARVIIMLRNPVEMIYSMHSQVVFEEIEDIRDFESALAVEDDRKQNRRIPSKCHIVNFLFYREFARYTEQVQRYLQIFKQENTHLIIFDDFKQDVARVYRDTLSFLEVSPEFQPATFRIVNRNKMRRNYCLRHILRQPVVVQSARLFMPSRSLRQGIIAALTINQAPRPPMDIRLKLRLQAEFRPEVEQLSILLGRDLTHWCQS